jgi:hypothetical protein
MRPGTPGWKVNDLFWQMGRPVLFFRSPFDAANQRLTPRSQQTHSSLDSTA